MPNILFDPLVKQLQVFEHVNITVSTASTGKRHYYINGQEYPSMTTVLSHKPKPELELWKKRIGEDKADRISKRARVRGTKLHTIIESYIPGNVVEFEHALQREMFQQVKKEIDEHLSRVYALENVVWSRILGLAGRIDLCGLWDGEPAIIDLKTTDKEKKREWIEDYFIQETGYCEMVNYVTRGKIYPKRLVILIASENSDRIQKFESHRDDHYDHLIERIDDYHKGNL